MAIILVIYASLYSVVTLSAKDLWRAGPWKQGVYMIYTDTAGPAFACSQHGGYSCPCKRSSQRLVQVLDFLPDRPVPVMSLGHDWSFSCLSAVPSTGPSSSWPGLSAWDPAHNVAKHQLAFRELAGMQQLQGHLIAMHAWPHLRPPSC